MDEGREAVQVQLLDDRPIVLQALRRALDGTPGFEVAGASTDPAELVLPLPDDVVLVSSASQQWHTNQVSAEDVDLGDTQALRLVLTSDASAGSAPAPPSASPTLTALEFAALGSAAAGMSATEAARSLGVSVKSVENARGRAKEKLGAVNIAEAVHLAKLTDDGRAQKSPTRPEGADGRAG